jgi:hypothetical protein
MNTYAHLWYYLGEFYLECELLQTEQQSKQKHTIFFTENRAVMR